MNRYLPIFFPPLDRPPQCVRLQSNTQSLENRGKTVTLREWQVSLWAGGWRQLEALTRERQQVEWEARRAARFGSMADTRRYRWTIWLRPRFGGVRPSKKLHPQQGRGTHQRLHHCPRDGSRVSPKALHLKAWLHPRALLLISSSEL